MQTVYQISYTKGSKTAERAASGDTENYFSFIQFYSLQEATERFLAISEFFGDPKEYSLITLEKLTLDDASEVIEGEIIRSKIIQNA